MNGSGGSQFHPGTPGDGRCANGLMVTASRSTMRIRLVAAAGAVAAVVFCAGGPTVAHAATSQHEVSSTGTHLRAPDMSTGSIIRHGLSSSNSLDWAGYAVTGPTITSVSGSWTQPAAICPGTKAQQSAFWVGIDGFTSDSTTVEQIGTDADCTKGTHRNPGGPVYYAWFEMYPLPLVVLDPATYPVTPGNVLSASVTASGSNYVLAITNVGHWSFSTTQVAPGGTLNTSAELVTEAPLLCKDGKCKPIALADFSSVAFTGATVNGVALTAPGLTANRITMTKNRKGTVVKASPSVLDPTGRAFVISWLHV